VSLLDMQLLCRIIQLGSTGRAALSLGISRTRARHCMARLESFFGGQLVCRNTWGTDATPAGQEALETAREVVDSVCTPPVHASSGPCTGNVTLSVDSGLSSCWLAPLLPEFAHRYPDIRLNILDQHLTVQNLSTADAEIAILPFPPAEPKRFDCVKLCVWRTYLYGSAEYLSQKGMPLSPSDLDHHHLVTWFDGDERLVPEVTRKALLWLGRKGGSPLRPPHLRVRDDILMISMVAQGLGLALMPRYQARFLPNLVRIPFYEETPEHKSTLHFRFIAWPRALRDSPPHQALADFLTAKAQDTTPFVYP
jgi:DNA-binding transcriptional LysR family regulator